MSFKLLEGTGEINAIQRWELARVLLKEVQVLGDPVGEAGKIAAPEHGVPRTHRELTHPVIILNVFAQRWGNRRGRSLPRRNSRDRQAGGSRFPGGREIREVGYV